MKLLKKLIFIIIFFTLGLNSSFAQGKIANFQWVQMNFFSLSAQLNSNGWALGYRWGHFVSIYQRNYWEIGLTHIKDPREVKFSNPFYLGGDKIFYGKINDMYDLRFGLGKMHIITWKQDIGSVEIRFFNSFGASVAMIKPVYYKILDISGKYSYYSKFSDKIMLSQIMQMAPFSMGLSEIKPDLGGYLKIGISFEGSQSSRGIFAVMVGSSITAYLLPVKLLYGQNYKNIFINLFVGARIGLYYPPAKKVKKSAALSQIIKNQ